MRSRGARQENSAREIADISPIRTSIIYIDVLPKFVKGYNATVHTTTGMAPSDVSDTDVLTIWNKMRGKAGKTAFKQAKISGRPTRAHQ